MKKVYVLVGPSGSGKSTMQRYAHQPVNDVYSWSTGDLVKCTLGVPDLLDLNEKLFADDAFMFLLKNRDQLLFTYETRKASDSSWGFKGILMQEAPRAVNLRQHPEEVVTAVELIPPNSILFTDTIHQAEYDDLIALLSELKYVSVTTVMLKPYQAKASESAQVAENRTAIIPKGLTREFSYTIEESLMVVSELLEDNF